jgi:hypothetical protein
MPVASRMKSSEKMPKASGKTGATSNVPGALVSLNLSHRLFATFESDKQGRKRSKKVHVLPPSPSTDEPESTECSDDEPIYRGSVAHLVLQKIDEIDQTFLRDEPDDFAMAKEGIDEAHQGQKKSCKVCTAFVSTAHRSCQEAIGGYWKRTKYYYSPRDCTTAA